MTDNDSSYDVPDTAEEADVSVYLVKPDSDEEFGLDFGWRVYGQLSGAISAVDSKASIILGLETLAFGLAVSQSSDGSPFGNLEGITRAAFVLGLVAVFASVVLAVLVVAPHLNRKRNLTTWRTGITYFGHLVHWDPTDLRDRLATLKPDALSMLSEQCVLLSRIAWRKHVLLQQSLVTFVIGACLLTIAALA